LDIDKDTYRTILTASEVVLFKDRHSKFFGYAFPVITEDHVKSHLLALKKEHRTAGHFCYAYQLGIKTISYRTNDDGEPNNSAGMPIYGQIQSFKITNTLVVVVRYFGGTKLGVSGLINAYKTTAQMALETSNIVEQTINKIIIVSCPYKQLNTVMRIIKEKKLTIIDQDMHLECKVTLQVRLKEADIMLAKFENLQDVSAKYS